MRDARSKNRYKIKGIFHWKFPLLYPPPPLKISFIFYTSPLGRMQKLQILLKVNFLEELAL